MVHSRTSLAPVTARATALSSPLAAPLGWGALGGTLDDVALRVLAAARPELAWPIGRDIALARNAHYTNTRAQLAAALAGDFDWMEGDVAVLDGVPVMRHRTGDQVDLDLATWLRHVAASGRGAKIDVKDPDALPAVLELARRSAIPQHRLIFNVTLLPAASLQVIRRAFPDAIINLSPIADGDLTPAELIELQVAARVVGGRVMFPIRIDLLTTEVLSALRPFGRVAIWNTPQLWNPRRDERMRLRAQGVDGMIDLRAPSGIDQRVQSALISAAAHVFGWDSVHAALDALGILERP